MCSNSRRYWGNGLNQNTNRGEALNHWGFGPARASYDNPDLSVVKKKSWRIKTLRIVCILLHSNENLLRDNPKKIPRFTYMKRGTETSRAAKSGAKCIAMD
jgi:hypothetical protein